MAETERIPRVLVVDDEPNIRELVQVALKFHGCTVSTASNGSEAIRQAEVTMPDLIVLDVMLPDIDGFEVCRRLRAGGQRGTGHLPDRTGHLIGYRDRARDRRRRLRDQAILGRGAGREGARRAAASVEVRAAARHGDHDDVLRAGDLELDESRWIVRRGGTPVELSKTEFQLLAYLMRHQGRVLTRAQLLENVWGWDYAGESQIVETYVSYLRRKLDPLGPPLIHTQRGVGYSLRLPEHAAAHRAHQARQTWQPGDDPGSDSAANPGGNAAAPAARPAAELGESAASTSAGQSGDGSHGPAADARPSGAATQHPGTDGQRDGEPGRRGAEPGRV